MKKRLMIMAGGTGGHIFPGLAVAKKLQEQGWDITWLGTQDRMEAQLVPQHGIEIDFIEVEGIKGQKLMRMISAPLQIIKAIFQAKKIIKKRRPDVILGMGGYVSGPGGLAGYLSGTPLIIHEQNAVAGLTNSWLAKLATKTFQAFPGAIEHAQVVGNPVRDDLCDISSPNERILKREGALKILIVGGSQGAQILNETVPDCATKLLSECEFWHQAGKGKHESVIEDYRKNNIDNVKVTEFIDDMKMAYEWADLIICRSGALTVSEIAQVGIGAIFVPFQHKDRQQALNGDFLVKQEAAFMIEQTNLSPERLADQINDLNRVVLADMANKAKMCAKPDAANDVANAIIKMSEGS